MEKKIYVDGLDESKEGDVIKAVSAVAGVAKCLAFSAKAQVLVEFDEATSGIEDAINGAISSFGIQVLN